MGRWEIDLVRRALGVNIRLSREKVGWTQARLAKRVRLHPVYLSQVERGVKPVSVEALAKIARALKISVAHLVRGLSAEAGEVRRVIERGTLGEI